MSLTSNDEREALTALRDLLAGRLEEASAKETASIARELREVVAKLAAMPVAEEKSELDDLAARREKRRAGIPADSAQGVQRGKRSG